ncbi:MAG: hypothetical protein ABR592_10720 [Nitriliruptorales bacterium]
MTRIRDYVPARVRRPLASARRSALFRLGAHELRRQGPSPVAVQRLAIGWGNASFRAGDRYLLMALEYVAASPGPILECGSGLTTLALALTPGVTAPVWSLEHEADWADAIRHRSEFFRAMGPAVLNVPLVRYGDIEWYAVPPALPDQFDLVICDGPPGGIVGGRWGLWEVLGERVTTATVLLDDAHRDGEAAIIRRLREQGWKVEIHPDGEKSFAIAQPRAEQRLPGGSTPAAEPNRKGP